MRRSTILALLVPVVFMAACSSGEPVEPPKPVWVRVNLLFPDEVTGEKSATAICERTQPVTFFDDKGNEVGTIELAESTDAPQDYDGWTSQVIYGENLCVEYGCCKFMLDEFQSEGIGIRNTEKSRDINGFMVHFGQHYRSSTHVRLAVLGETFYIRCRWGEFEDYGEFFQVLVESIDVEALEGAVGEKAQLAGMA